MATSSLRQSYGHSGMSCLSRFLFAAKTRVSAELIPFGTDSFGNMAVVSGPELRIGGFDSITVRAYPYAADSSEDSVTTMTLKLQSTVQDVIAVDPATVVWVDVDSLAIGVSSYPGVLEVTDLKDDWLYLRTTLKRDSYTGSTSLFDVGVDMWVSAWNWEDDLESLRDNASLNFSYDDTELALDLTTLREG